MVLSLSELHAQMSMYDNNVPLAPLCAPATLCNIHAKMAGVWPSSGPLIYAGASRIAEPEALPAPTHKARLLLASSANGTLGVSLARADDPARR